MNVGQLREQLEQFPDYYPVVVEVTVGGDITADDVEVLAVGSDGYSSVRITPAPDEYDVAGLIDDGLLLRAIREGGVEHRHRPLRHQA